MRKHVFVRLALLSAIMLGSTALLMAVSVGESSVERNSAYIAVGRPAVPFDFDGDRKADVAYFHLTSGAWKVIQSSNRVERSYSFSPVGTKLAPADYDGDGKFDPAVYRWGSWTIYGSSAGMTHATLGSSNGFPVPGDFDGDKKADLAAFVSGLWTIKTSSNNRTVTINHGYVLSTPFSVDTTGDGKAELVVFSNGTWQIMDFTTRRVTQVSLGRVGDIAVPADYDGDGKTDLAVCSKNGVLTWQIRRSSNLRVDTGGYGFSSIQDIPTPADYDGDGRADQSVFRSPGQWFVLQTSNGASVQTSGGFGSYPVEAAFIRTGY